MIEAEEERDGNAMATGERVRQWTHSERPSPKGAREAQPGRDE